MKRIFKSFNCLNKKINWLQEISPPDAIFSTNNNRIGSVPFCQLFLIHREHEVRGFQVGSRLRLSSYPVPPSLLHVSGNEPRGFSSSYCYMVSFRTFGRICLCRLATSTTILFQQRQFNIICRKKMSQMTTIYLISLFFMPFFNHLP